MLLYKALKITTWLIILCIAYGFWKGKIKKLRTKVLLLLWMAIALFLALHMTRGRHEELEAYSWLFQSIFIAAALLTTYWIFKSIKDWLDPKREKRRQI